MTNEPVKVMRSELASLLPSRPSDMHKGTRGRLIIMGGCENYIGAPALSALGALRSGGGIVMLLSLPCVCNACAARLPEIVYKPVPDVGNWPSEARTEFDANNAAVIGPGLGRSDAAIKTVQKIWQDWRKPLLVDGDGLYALSVSSDSLPSRDDAILTPHEGEAARLLGETAAWVRENRMVAVRSLADRWGCAVLKGQETLIARRDDDCIRCVDFGGPELSVPGSGDVLSGCIGALLAMGLTPVTAGALGVALHGLAGESLRVGGVDGVLASEIAHTIRDVLCDLRGE